jgi:predicted AAA+ superfamily ATPase
MKRNIEKQLHLWFLQAKKKPLIIKGARQVGKTYIIREFAKQHYNHVVEINFERQLEFVELFEKTHDPKDILDYLKLSFLDIEFNQTTLVFLDEIQASSHAITSLKFLAEEFPCDIICSGSTLGVAIATSSSFPVGYVDTWTLSPMSFTEFLWALGVDQDVFTTLQTSLKHTKPLSDALHTKLNSLFKDYVMVGGMPEAVKTFVATRSLQDVVSVQRRIVQDYYSDMAKYALGSDRIKTRECYQSIPLQLAKDNKKFQYKLAKEGYSSRYFESSLRWLEESGFIIKVNRLAHIEKPLEAYVELPTFKIYMSDTGLLISQFDEGVLKSLLSNDLGIFKGALYENICAQMLHTYGKRAYYYEPNQNSEIDFIIYYEGMITPLEVKSSTHTRSTSLINFIHTFKPTQAFRLSMRNLGKQEPLGLRSLPFYMFEFLLEDERNVFES